MTKMLIKYNGWYRYRKWAEILKIKTEMANPNTNIDNIHNDIRQEFGKYD